MRRTLKSAGLFIALILPAFCQPQANAPNVANPSTAALGQLDGSPTIFAVLAAANAAGYDSQVNAVSNSPLRKLVRERLAAQHLDSLPPLQRYLRDHRPTAPNAELGQYISFALFSSGPPDFKPIRTDVPLPPDAAALEDLPPLLAAFYKEAHLADLWQEAQPYYDQEIAKYTRPVSQAVLEVNAYLRNPTSGYLGRRFQVFVDLLGEPNQIHVRNYVDDYYIVVTPSPEPPVDLIRHAYLRYLLDPLGIKYSDELKRKKALGEYALGSPILSELYRNDFIMLATESLIKAVESRLPAVGADLRGPTAVEQALREGFVLTPAFAEQLAQYEKQDRALRLYFPDMLEAIDMKREEKRLAHIDFIPERAVRIVRPAAVTPEAAPVLTGAEKTLRDADDAAYTARDYPHAKDLYLRVLQETDQTSMHAKAYYGLARIAVLERDPETGDRLFRKVLELEPDATTKAWSLLYLGKLADSQGDRDQAVEYCKAALAVPGVPDQVRQEAEKGLKESFGKK